MRKESSTLQKCKRQMATLGFDSQLAYHRVKLILKIYRDVVWVLSERVEELHEYAWELGAQDADTGLIYLQSFAPDMDLQEFEERVCCVMENRMLVDVIDRALLRLKRYPDRGELYYEILTKQFIHRFNSTEKELLDELNMERSVFYDRKREAIFLLSLCLFGYRKEDIRRGDIYYADLRPVVGSEQGGIRPVVILQNNVGNRHSPTVIAAAITSRKGKHKLPTHVNLDAPVPGLYRDSIILLEQLRTIDKSRLRDKLGSLGEDQMCKLDHALEVSVGLLPIYNTI